MTAPSSSATPTFTPKVPVGGAVPSGRPAAVTRAIDPVLSQKFRFWSLVAMVLLVYVHAFNLHPRYLQPMTLV